MTTYPAFIRTLSRITLTAVLLMTTICRIAAAADYVIYSDALASGWENWSWNTTVNPAVTSPVKSGTNSIAVTYNTGWGGLSLHPASPIGLSSDAVLRFWIHGGSAGTQQLNVVANGNAAATYPVTASANSWTQVEVPLTQLGSPTTLTDLYWQDNTNGAQPVFYLDEIVLSTTPPPPPPPPVLAIDVAADRHAINPDIYGMNFASEQLAADLHLPVNRRGGNSTSRYNWMIDAYNTGNDWYYENIAETNTNTATLPNGSAADTFVEQNQRTGTKSIITVPLIGWVAKSRKETHPFDCGFMIPKYGAQDDKDSQYEPNCGNGIHNGINITGNDPTDTSTPVTPQFVSNWIAHLTARYGTSKAGGVNYYSLDNEPMLWNSTHRDVHPAPVDYDELLGRTLQYAPVIKTVDPSAQTLGPVLWGWCAYFWSAKDDCGSSSADYAAHGNTYFVPWYLQQMKLYEEQKNLRILDYLDLHIYPQGPGVYDTRSTDDPPLRLRSTRALWDPTYVDESWINDTIQLIPRMRSWVDTYYPGTKLAISEYSWGSPGSLNGALAQADILGIFGRERLDLATLWVAPQLNQPAAQAFRMFRNYDSAGHGFGETGVRATSSDQDTLAVYAAQRNSDNIVTVIVINKTGNDLPSNISFSGIAPEQTAAVYRYSGANLAAIEHLPNQSVSGTAISTTFPANSITLYEVIPRTFVTLSVSVSGSGTVTSVPTGINCEPTSSECSVTFPVGQSVTLSVATAPSDSFSNWSGDCNGTETCRIDMGTDHSVSATFGQLPAIARTGSAGYETLTAAYRSAVPGGTIQIRNQLLNEHLTFDMNKSVKLTGGYADDFATRTGPPTIVKGATISSGTLVADQLFLR